MVAEIWTIQVAISGFLAMLVPLTQRERWVRLGINTKNHFQWLMTWPRWFGGNSVTWKVSRGDGRYEEETLGAGRG